MSEKKSSIRKRNWAAVIYPESLPKNWEEIIYLSGLKVAISPLHDKDKNADGTQKKAHYHMIYCYGNTTTYNNACNFSKSLGGTIPQALEQIRGYYRYFTHQDNPDKAQYNQKNIKTFNGFNINDYIDLSYSDRLELKLKVHDFINKNKIEEYDILLDMLILDENKDLYGFASDNTYLFSTYLKSKHFRKLEEKKGD